MKNLKLSNSCLNFLKNNKMKICSLALIGVMTISLTACNSTQNTNVNTNSTGTTQSINQKQERLSSLKQNIEKNIENIEVSKDSDKGWYVISENSFLEIPYYETDENGKLYVAHVEKSDMGVVKYNVSFEEAKELNLTELLESKLNVKTK